MRMSTEQITNYYPELGAESLHYFRQILDQESSKVDGVYNRPVAIDPGTKTGVRMLELLAQNLQASHESTTKIRFKPFQIGHDEFVQLGGYYKNFLEALGLDPAALEKDSLAAALRQQFVASFSFNIDTIAELSEMVDKSEIFTDLSELIINLLSRTSEHIIVDANYVYDHSAGTLTKWIDERTHRILQDSRLIGLISYESLRALREKKIVVIGASVAASTIALLVSLGVTNITFYDDGTMEPSNAQKMPSGETSDYRNNGMKKVYGVAASAYARNPYGQYLPKDGRVVFDESEIRKDTDDILFTELLTQEYDLIIEVVDNARTKILVRQTLEEQLDDTPVLFIADVGNNPFVGLEVAEEVGWFNQDLTDTQVQYLRQLAEGTIANSPINQLKAICLMVKDDLPEDHKLQVMLAMIGQTPFLAQTGIAARLSAAKAGSLLLNYFSQHSSGENLRGKNYSATDTELSHLVPTLSDRLNQVLNDTFNTSLPE